MTREKNGDDPGPGPCPPGEDAGETIARLREKIAFLEKKLRIVGSDTRHDVLNQLTAIVGYTELLEMMVDDPKIREYLGKEKQAIAKIRRQFQFAKDYQNIAAEPPRWQNIRNLVSRVSEDVDTRNIRITAGTGAGSVLADPLLDRVFYHIFDNALRHGETTSEIRVSLREGPGGAILLIENNGTSIPAAEKKRIFDRGFGKGTGWGLFLAREILSVTGMAIAETGEEGKGARFEILLPPGAYRPDGEE